MFGLCLPTGSVYLVYNNGKKENIMNTDLAKPKKEILNDKYILEWVKQKGYKNIKSISYERNGKKTIVEMYEYYAEHGEELEKNV